MRRTVVSLFVVALCAAAQARAGYRRIDLSIFGMD